LEAKVETALKRIAVLEAGQAGLTAGADELAAQRVAQRLGFGVEVLRVPAGTSARENAVKRLLASQLAGLEWSQARIARVLHVTERSVCRWLKEDKRCPDSGGGSGGGGGGGRLRRIV
jgi:hypothetical protein